MGNKSVIYCNDTVSTLYSCRDEFTRLFNLLQQHNGICCVHSLVNSRVIHAGWYSFNWKLCRCTHVKVM